MRTVFLTALLVRIAASVLLGRMVDPASARHPDSDYHHIAAVNIINGTPVTFSVKPNYTPPYKDEVNVIKGGYAIGLSVLYRIFGVSFEVGKWANILLGALLAVGVYLLTLRLANEKAAFYSGLIVACDPYLAYLSIQVLKDVPILLCIVFSWVGYLLLDKKNTGPALLLLSVSLILASHPFARVGSAQSRFVHAPFPLKSALRFFQRYPLTVQSPLLSSALIQLVRHLETSLQ